ncbi:MULTISPECIES: hypothetical protein [unclassified Streptomyces]|uniref:hypothetical protein n=1 Tax=unclassified Streptomyces TaxID=2593676 RepID=UPI000C273B87|nr:hypothetical protein [Streptomyces sp. CB01373]PJM97435.1 hypothetical protein CG719_00535 [Streptomyces sp. CB01373]
MIDQSNEVKPGFSVHPLLVFGLGWLLGLASLVERVPLIGHGRQYGLCHPVPSLGPFTGTALVLIGGAFLASSFGAVMVARTSPPRRVFPIACLLIVSALLTAADRVDVHGERVAAEAVRAYASVPADQCDYTPDVYTATPGWFSW